MQLIKRTIILLLLVILGHVLWAQSSIGGTVKNSKGEPMPLAVLQLIGEKIAVSANANGLFTIENVANGKHTVQASYLGYLPTSENVVLQNEARSVDFHLTENENLQNEVTVIGTRAGAKDPISHTNITAEQLKQLNNVQDVPYLLSLTPSVVTSSDAGNGVGYTSIKVRGTDANRINVTIDGIPMNDAESHGVWWVNMPDIASSTSSFQIQRGVGTSTQGAGAFGASINMQNSTINKVAYSTLSGSYGSYNTSKLTAKIGTGLLNDHFTFDARLSKINSDGYIDKSNSNLKSFYLSGGYLADNTTVKVDIFSGAEKTYQAWWGVPTVRLQNDQVGMSRYYEHGLYSYTKYKEMVNSNSRTYNYYTYDNQTDNYAQDHYHITLNQTLTGQLSLKIAGHYTYGRGYYENKEDSMKLSRYGLPNTIIGADTITRMNSANQKWLNNDFYGGVFSLNFKNNDLTLTLGGGLNQYDGRHYGKIIWTEFPSPVAKEYEWYHSSAKKIDGNIYIRASYRISKVINIFTDLQYRHIEYKILGNDDKGRNITQSHLYNFFNPKLGINANITDEFRIFTSLSVANREPNRSNFVDANLALGVPKSERLYDCEVGAEYKNTHLSSGITGYYMNYNDQLVMTGAINDVGSPIMTNVDESYRAGIELQAGYTTRIIDIMANATFSKNKIKAFDEYIDNWDTGGQTIIQQKDVDIAFAPNILASGIITIKPLTDVKVNFISQYVHRQFLDNTQSNDRYMAPYFVENLSLNYHLTTKFCKGIDMSFFVNNIFNRKYVSNGWIYSYTIGGERFTQDGLFPQAATNCMGNVTINF